MQKGQSALEFLITYGWAILLVLAILAALYYYGVFDAGRYVPRSCSLQPSLPCDSFRLGYNASAPAPLSFKLLTHNGLGADMNLTNFSISTENLGSAGRNNYTGACSSPNTNTTLARTGNLILCNVSITDSARIPRIGDPVRFTFSISYINCETAPNYASTGSCAGGTSHTSLGSVSTQLEYEAAISIPTP